MLGDIRITHLHGLFGIDEINYAVSLICSVFFIIVVTNGFNLIDGIDGLASGVGLVATVTFGCWFAMSGHNSYAVMSFALIGSLTAFFYFNVFGKTNKIFLGDTGSLILGFSISVFAIRFMGYELSPIGILSIESTPAVTFGILIIPLFDTLRIFCLRIFKNKSPFSADKQHIHHLLLNLGFTHLKSTVILLTFNLFIIGLSLSLQDIGNMNLILLQLTLAFSMTFVITQVLRKKSLKTQSIHYLNVQSQSKVEILNANISEDSPKVSPPIILKK